MKFCAFAETLDLDLGVGELALGQNSDRGRGLGQKAGIHLAVQ